MGAHEAGEDRGRERRDEDVATLTSPSVVRALLERHGLSADRNFGQNFLVDAHALERIVGAAELDHSDTAFEIGPGLGVLTRALSERAGRVVSVELDRRLEPVLAETLAGRTNVEVRFEDALAFDWSRLPERAVMVANLPYNVATPLIVRALESQRFARLVFLVQREVGERLVAAPGSSAYGALSAVVAHWAEGEVIRHVKPSSFLPAPDVTSSIVRLRPRPDAVAEPELLDFVHTCFRHRRKTLLKNLDLAGLSKETGAAALRSLGIDVRVRAEVLGLTEFRVLWRCLEHGEPNAE